MNTSKIKILVLAAISTVLANNSVARAAYVSSADLVETMYTWTQNSTWACYAGDHSDYSADHNFNPYTASTILKVTPDKDSSGKFSANIQGTLNGNAVTSLMAFNIGSMGSPTALGLGSNNYLTSVVTLMGGILGDHEGGPACEPGQLFSVMLGSKVSTPQTVTCCILDAKTLAAQAKENN